VELFDEVLVVSCYLYLDVPILDPNQREISVID
jgi:hypothetical protein